MTAPAPPWSRARRRAIQAYIEDVRRRLYLQHWEVVLPDDYPEGDPEEVLAMVVPTEGRFRARVTFGPGFWDLSRAEVRKAVVHELLHLHHIGMTDLVIHGAAMRELVGSQAWEPFVESFKRQAEYMVDGLSEIVAPLVPLPPARWPR